MDQETSFIVYEGVVVPESALLKKERSNRYGSIEDLPDEELADPDELERQFLRQEFAPVLALPVKTRKGWIRPNVDEDGRIDWGAFATVDFDRDQPEFDKARYKADKLREQWEDTILMLEMVRQRVPSKPATLILKYLWMGIIELEHILDFEMWLLARYYLRARKLEQEIAKLEEASQRRRQKKAEAFFASLD